MHGSHEKNDPRHRRENQARHRDAPRGRARVDALLLLLLALATCAGSHADAQVIATRYPHGGVYVAPVVTAPPPVVVVRPVPVPDVTIRVEPMPLPTAVRVRRGVYDTHGLVVAGVGVGGRFFLSHGGPDASLAYRLHLGLAVDAAEFAVDVDLAPTLGPSQDGSQPATSLHAFGASFRYRFLGDEDVDVHPTAGIGLEALFADTQHGDTLAFAASGHVGLELAYPLADGALALGLDLGLHHAFGAAAWPSALRDSLSTTAYVHYRF